MIILEQLKFYGANNGGSDEETVGFSGMLQKMNCGHVLRS